MIGEHTTRLLLLQFLGSPSTAGIQFPACSTWPKPTLLGQRFFSYYSNTFSNKTSTLMCYWVSLKMQDNKDHMLENVNRENIWYTSRKKRGKFLFGWKNNCSLIFFFTKTKSKTLWDICSQNTYNNAVLKKYEIKNKSKKLFVVTGIDFLQSYH